MRTGRLLRLARYLDDYPANQFDIGSFFSGYWMEGAGLVCTRCALGCLPLIWPKVYSPGWNGYGRYLAGPDTAEFFGITKRQWKALFLGEGYDLGRKVQPKDVAAKIRRILKRCA